MSSKRSHPRTKKKHSSSLVDNIVDAGYALGAAAAKAAKKKKIKPSSSQVKNSLKIFHSRSSSFSAPAAIGTFRSSSSVKHKPVSVESRSIACYVYITSAGVIQLSNADAGALQNLNTINIDPSAFGVASNNFALFPQTVRNLTTTFTRYRFRKLRATWIPVDPTSAGRTFAMGAFSEVVTTNTNQTFGSIANSEYAMTGPTWLKSTMDLLTAVPDSSHWRYVDFHTSTSDSDLRQESLGSLSIGFVGAFPATTLAIGFVEFDYMIELDGIANIANFSSSHPSPSTERNHSSSTSLPPLVDPVPGLHPPSPRLGPVPEFDAHIEDLSESVHIDRNAVNSIKALLSRHV